MKKKPRGLKPICISLKHVETGHGGLWRTENPKTGTLDFAKQKLFGWVQTTDDDGQPMTDEELWEDVHDIMGAGHETTATTTASTLYCISAHPEVERRIVAELQRVLGTLLPTLLERRQDDLRKETPLKTCHHCRNTLTPTHEFHLST